MVVLKAIKEGMSMFGHAFSAPFNLVLLSVVYFIGVGLSVLLKKSVKKKKCWEDCVKDGKHYRQF